MSALTIRLPDSPADKLKPLARRRSLSVNKLIKELGTQAVAVHDTESRSRAIAAQGDTKAALKVLDRLDRLDADARWAQNTVLVGGLTQ